MILSVWARCSILVSAIGQLGLSSKPMSTLGDMDLRDLLCMKAGGMQQKGKIERDVVPMCKSEGMVITVWGSLDGGKFKGAAQSNDGKGLTYTDDLGGASPDTFQKVLVALEKVAERKGTSNTSVALRYVMLKVGGSD